MQRLDEYLPKLTPLCQNYLLCAKTNSFVPKLTPLCQNYLLCAKTISFLSCKGDSQFWQAILKTFLPGFALFVCADRVQEDIKQQLQILGACHVLWMELHTNNATTTTTVTIVEHAEHYRIGFSEVKLFGWCFEPSQPLRLTSGLNTKF